MSGSGHFDADDETVERIYPPPHEMARELARARGEDGTAEGSGQDAGPGDGEEEDHQGRILANTAVMAAGTVVSRFSGFIRSTLLAAALLFLPTGCGASEPAPTVVEAAPAPYAEPDPYGEEVSQFDYEPPFRPRRPWFAPAQARQARAKGRERVLPEGSVS